MASGDRHDRRRRSAGHRPPSTLQLSRLKILHTQTGDLINRIESDLERMQSDAVT